MGEEEAQVQRAKEKLAAISEIEQTLAHVTTDGRVPDAWERDSIAFALRACLSGFYNLARASCVLAETPLAQRAPLLSSPDDVGFTVETLREALAQLRRHPC